MNWYLQVMQKYAVFGGRARRSEFWYFTLITTVISYILARMDIVAHYPRWEDGNMGILEGTYSLLTLIPTIAVSVRRLHDIGRSGWWLLCYFIPIVGWIVLLVFHCQDSEVGHNSYGSNPKNLRPSALDY